MCKHPTNNHDNNYQTQEHIITAHSHLVCLLHVNRKAKHSHYAYTNIKDIQVNIDLQYFCCCECSNKNIKIICLQILGCVISLESLNGHIVNMF